MPKRAAEIAKSYEEMAIRMELRKAESDRDLAVLRLRMLIHYNSSRTQRQIFNLAKLGGNNNDCTD